jgi:hypothetical protein
MVAASVGLVATAAHAQTKAWPRNVTAIEAKSGSVVEIKGKLEAGKTIPLTWAGQSSVACFPATEFDNFKGNHVFYGTALPRQSVMKVTVVPDNKTLDVNVYALQVSSTDFARVPPKMPTATACEAGFNQQTETNPGVTESVTLNATTNPYNVVIGVAGPKGVVAGGYTLKVELTTKAEVQSATLVPVAVESKSGSVVTVKGKLEDGGKIALDWAAKSSMACWPSTEDMNFNGNHTLFTTTLPSYSDLQITAVPLDPKLDLSVYSYMVSATSTPTLPPGISSALSCEAGYDAKKDKNPGASETVKQIALKNPYRVVIGVAGANGAATGPFELKIDVKPKK